MVFRRTSSTHFSHKVCWRAEKWRGRRSQPQHRLQKMLPEVVPSLPLRRRAEAHSCISEKQLPLLLMLWISGDQPSSAKTLKKQDAEACCVACVCSLVQHHAVAETKCYSLTKCFKIYFSGEKTAWQIKPQTWVHRRIQKLIFFFKKTKYIVSCLIKIVFYLWFQ